MSEKFDRAGEHTGVRGVVRGRIDPAEIKSGKTPVKCDYTITVSSDRTGKTTEDNLPLRYPVPTLSSTHLSGKITGDACADKCSLQGDATHEPFPGSALPRSCSLLLQQA